MHAKIFGDLVIGRGSVVAGGAIVRESVPCFSVVAGSPARVVKLYDFEEKKWLSVKRDDEVSAALKKRETQPPPDRAAYAEHLHRNYHMGALDPVLAGAGRSI
jgi:tetrahydrodipicolinate N-succinyltransferase